MGIKVNYTASSRVGAALSLSTADTTETADVSTLRNLFFQIRDAAANGLQWTLQVTTASVDAQRVDEVDVEWFETQANKADAIVMANPSTKLAEVEAKKAHSYRAAAVGLRNGIPCGPKVWADTRPTNLRRAVYLGGLLLTAKDVAWLAGVLESERDRDETAATAADGLDAHRECDIAAEKVERAERMLSALRKGGGQ